MLGKNIETYGDFPLIIPIITIIFSLVIYLLGVYILLGFGIIVSLVYLLYCFVVEFFVLKRSCVNCYYYGKICGLGKGKICELIFKRGVPGKFNSRQIHFYDLLPDFLTFIIPLVGGIILLFIKFSWFTVIAMILILFLSLVGNMVIRGSLVCKYCKQREFGCPADQFFNKKRQYIK